MCSESERPSCTQRACGASDLALRGRVRQGEVERRGRQPQGAAVFGTPAERRGGHGAALTGRGAPARLAGCARARRDSPGGRDARGALDRGALPSAARGA